MKRIRRILFNTLTAISLLFAIATAAVWARSHWVHDQFVYSGDRTLVQIVSFEDKFGFETLVKSYSRSALGARLDSFPAGRNALMRSDDSFQVRRRWSLDAAGTRRELIFVAVPYWCVMIGFAFMPILWWRLTISRRPLAGLRPACGYDMRANPAKCSECGHEAKPTGGHTETI